MCRSQSECGMTYSWERDKFSKRCFFFFFLQRWDWPRLFNLHSSSLCTSGNSYLYRKLLVFCPADACSLENKTRTMFMKMMNWIWIKMTNLPIIIKAFLSSKLKGYRFELWTMEYNFCICFNLLWQTLIRPFNFIISWIVYNYTILYILYCDLSGP